MFEVYQNIKRRREFLGYSQGKLGDLVGYDSGRSMIAKIEAGQVDISYSTLIRIAEALQIEPQQLMGDSNATILSDDELRLLDHYRRLSPLNKQLADRVIFGDSQ